GGHGGEQVEIVAVLRAVAVDAGEEDLPGAALDAFADPGQGVFPRRAAATVRHHLPTGTRTASVDREDDALAAEAPSQAIEQLGLDDGGGVDPDLVGAGEKQAAGVLFTAHAASHGER